MPPFGKDLSGVFESAGPHYCPNGCFLFLAVPLSERTVTQKVRMELVARGHPTAATDICRCPKCGKAFRIKYKAQFYSRHKVRDKIPEPEWKPR